MPETRVHPCAGRRVVSVRYVCSGVCVHIASCSQAACEQCANRIPAECKKLEPAALAVLQDELQSIATFEKLLQPLSGGCNDGTVWTQAYDATSGPKDILKYFAETLDKIIPGTMDKLNKQLTKARSLLRSLMSHSLVPVEHVHT